MAKTSASGSYSEIISWCYRHETLFKANDGPITNDLKNSSPTEVAERVVNLASEIEKTSETKVIISELVARRDKNDQVKAVNKQLRKHALPNSQSNGWTLIQHNNISRRFADDLNRGRLHLNREGNCKFFKNFVDTMVTRPYT